MKSRKCFIALVFTTVYFMYHAMKWFHADVLIQNISEKDKMISNHVKCSKISQNLTKDSLFSMQGVTINPHYLLANPLLCTYVENLTVVLIVHTAPSHFKHRLAIRRTMANNSYYQKIGSVRVLFLLGALSNMSLQNEIEDEFNQYGDILQGDFIDSYHNLTYKGVMAYKWLSENCRNAKIVLKIDDDVVVDMFRLLSNYKSSLQYKTNFIICSRLKNAKINRNPSSKWFVDNAILTGQKQFPAYCQGFVVIISNDLIPSLYKSTLRTPFFWIDDVYLYGMVPRNISGIHYMDMKYGKEVVWGADKAHACYESGVCQYMAVMIWSNIPFEMNKIWNLIAHNYSNNSIPGQNHNIRRHH